MTTGDEQRSIYLRPWIWAVYAMLAAIAVPWYWPAGDPTLILGVPAWVAVAIGASAAISAFTAYLMSWPWPGEEDEEDAA